MRTDHWAAARPFWPEGHPFPRPFAWGRARLLYALLPADGSLFKILRRPLNWVPFLLKLCPFYGISIMFFVLKFIIIEKRDEYQLVSYILSFKSFQFLTAGLLLAVEVGWQLYFCLVSGYESQLEGARP